MSRQSRILIVEDDKIASMDVRMLLMNLGYEIVGEAASAGEAISLAGKLWPDLVLMDIFLGPGIDGIDLAAELQSLHDVPVIYLTAYSDEQTTNRARRTGPFGYLIKPVDERLLHITIENSLYRHRMERCLTEEKERFRALVENARDVIARFDRQGRYLYINPVASSYMPLAPGDFPGRSPAELGFPPGKGWEECLGQVFETGETRELEIIFEGLRGKTSFNCRIFPEFDARGGVSSAVLAARDITARKVMEEALCHQAFHDSLTGLPNRSLFADRLGRAVERSKRRDDFLFAVLFIDLDRFKAVNDSLGHMAGDELLVLVAERLRRCLRAMDTVARFGGDEFVVLLEDIVSHKEAVRVARRILEELKAPFPIAGHEACISGSIGIVLGPRIDDRVEDIVRDADISMHRAKEQGRDRLMIYHAKLHGRIMRFIQVESDLRKALEREELDLHFQPIVHLDSGRLDGLEALVRWRHPLRGLILPRSFIPVAEESGLILPLGAWVLAEACQQARGWLDTCPDLSVSVNISARQFARRDFPDQLGHVLRDSGLDSRHLRLDISEALLVDDARAAGRLLDRLAALGVRVCVDDFGVGRSCLANLCSLCLDGLKIDLSLTKGMNCSKTSSLVKTIIELAHSLKIPAIAEGVETGDQSSALHALGCDYAQGFLYARPMSGAAVASLLAARAANPVANPVTRQ